jgi:aspartate racemase
MKNIGILGGIGPQATIDFETRLHLAAQRLVPQHGNSGYPGLTVYYHRRPPFIMADERTPALPLQADPDLLEAARWLATRSDLLIITANGPHMVQEQIEEAAGCKVLSMIEVTLDEVRKRGWRKFGVLGFGDPTVMVYTRPLSQLNLAFETITPELQGRLNAVIFAFYEGVENERSIQAVQAAVAHLREKFVDGIILGCTELPLLLHEYAEADDLINPAQLLAEAAVKQAFQD